MRRQRRKLDGLFLLEASIDGIVASGSNVALSSTGGISKNESENRGKAQKKKTKKKQSSENKHADWLNLVFLLNN